MGISFSLKCWSSNLKGKGKNLLFSPTPHPLKKKKTKWKNSNISPSEKFVLKFRFVAGHLTQPRARAHARTRLLACYTHVTSPAPCPNKEIRFLLFAV